MTKMSDGRVLMYHPNKAKAEGEDGKLKSFRMAAQLKGVEQIEAVPGVGEVSQKSLQKVVIHLGAQTKEGESIQVRIAYVSP